MFSGLDLYCADRAQPLTAAGEEPDDLDRDLSEVSTLVLLHALPKRLTRPHLSRYRPLSVGPKRLTEFIHMRSSEAQ